VGSDVGGIVELISNYKNGIIFKSGNIEDLQSVIIKILNPLNKNQYIQIVEEGLKYVREEKSWEKNALIYKDLYFKINHDLYEEC
jgi:glycosyltransferase involved in cell wall biosynthesis